MDEKRQEVMESIEAVEERFKADIKSLEENNGKDRTGAAGYDRMKAASGSFDDSFGTGSKHDRIKMEEDDEDDDPHSAYQYEQDEQPDVPEGPALPASMVSRFKITIHNTDHKQGKKGFAMVTRNGDGYFKAIFF